MFSLNGLAFDGSVVGYALLAFVIIYEILFCVALVSVIFIPRQLKKYQARTEERLTQIENELKTLNAVVEKNVMPEKEFSGKDSACS